MLKKILFLLIIALITGGGLLAQTGAIQGVVKDENKEPVPFANVIVELDGNMITGAPTDFDGNYMLKPVPAGTFTVKVSCIGFHPQTITGVLVNADKNRFLDIEIKSTSVKLVAVQVIAYKVPLFDKDNTQSGETVTSKQIEKMTGRGVSSVATTVGGVYSEDGEVGSMRGGRSDANITIIDGMKVIGGSNLPASAIGQISVIMGGIPAKYGDVTGGITNITLKGISKKTFGGVELITSQFLDDFGYNLIGGSLSGPLWVKKDSIAATEDEEAYVDEKSIIGYFLSFEGSYEKDQSPQAIDIWTAEDDVIDNLIARPLRDDGSRITYFNADYLDKNNFKTRKSRENNDSKHIMLAGKLDFSLGKNTKLTFGTSVDYDDYRGYSFSNSLFNSENNGQGISSVYRAYLRLTQKFLDKVKQDESGEDISLIKNVFYNIQLDFERVGFKSQDKEHKDNFFDYGYIGKFNIEAQERYNTFGADTVDGVETWGFIHDNFTYFLVDDENGGKFESGDKNPELANYTQQVFDWYGENMFETREIGASNGMLNGDAASNIYGLWTAPGVASNGYSTSVRDQFRLTASGSADIKKHEVSFGFEFEQRTERYFSVSPRGLWTLADGLTNQHIMERDLSNPEVLWDNELYSTIIRYDRLYNESFQSQFDEELRKHLGKDVSGTEWINIHALDPSDLSLDYFSADELLNNGSPYVSYYGYDHHGEELENDPSFDDFFTKRDENGRLTREIAPFSPIYIAGYIQDKFSFDELIFNIGVRVDRFDANQKVLKDKYLLHPAYKAGDQATKDLLGDKTRPSNIGDDFIVYTNSVNNPTQITGYRDESTWYDQNGTEIGDPALIYSANGPAPFLIDKNAEFSSQAFEDYEPQVTFMPRISFSFPISDEALFFAHYDVLSKRPTSSVRLDPVDYLFIQQLGSGDYGINNPNLKPEKTIDYELGFKQKLSNYSSLSLSGFYKEQRDMVQMVNIVGAYPARSYRTYDNIDFGTVKGFTGSFDLRRLNNVQMRISYTLQFASATGSDAATARGLIQAKQPNLRTIFPTNFDQRHSITTNIDYRFPIGKDYNGPDFAKKVLQGMGANFTIQAGSGSPYTRRRDVQFGGSASGIYGSVNGARKPWRTTIGLKIDKDFKIKTKKTDDKKSKVYYLTVYIDISNLLNTQNIIDVYSVTGNADDDGYLQAPESQRAIDSQRDREAFINYYTMAMEKPWYYTRPRTIKLGASFSF